MEDEIFQSFSFFAEVVPQFDFPFSNIGRTGFDRYLKLNEALLTFSKQVWPDVKDPQTVLTWFLYNGLGGLFIEKSDYNRYWIMVTKPENFETLDENDQVTWSARKEMQIGDVVFFYRTSPRSAITDIFEVIEEPYFDAWAEWDGFWVELARVCSIPDITYSDMKKDKILKDWKALRKNFYGVRTDLIQHSIYNRLLDKIPASLKKQHELNPEPVTEAATREYTTEAEFEQDFIEPLLKRWNFRYQTQYSCSFWVGRQSYRGRVDMYVEGITLFENKLQITNERELKPAVEQGKSYALLLGLPSFVVASPQGLWIYSLEKNQANLEKHILMKNFPAQNEEIRDLILSLSKQ